MSNNTTSSAPQGLLARLLAAENIEIQVGNYKTASFAPETRVLRLPTWNTDSKDISDLLIGHEVGHALFTSMGLVDDFNSLLPDCPFDVLNVIEDVRIERLIQNKFPGLIAPFRRGYQTFKDRNFFEIDGKDINTLSLIDKINVKAKLGPIINISFKSDEKYFFEKSLKTETEKDVINLCKELYDYIKKEASKSNNDVKPDVEETDDVTNDEANTREADTNNDLEEDTSMNVSDTIEEDSASSISNDNEDLDKELISSTMNSLNDSVDTLKEEYKDDIPIFLPKREIRDLSIISWKDILKGREDSVMLSTGENKYKEFFIENRILYDNYVRFKKQTRKNIQYLITEFERKKAAYQYSRSKTSDTGDVDIKRLHEYKFSDNIFKTVTQEANAKSHGMIFFIDYSGSMVHDLPAVIEHTINLIIFCEAVKIPYTVYGFSTLRGRCLSDDDDDSYENQISFKNTNIFQLLGSDINKKDNDLLLYGLYARMMGLNVMSSHEVLGGTPLNSTIILAHDIVSDFKKRYKTQKNTVIFLNDGNSDPFFFGKEPIDSLQKKIKSANYILDLNGRRVKIANKQSEKPESTNFGRLIENLRITCDVNTICFRLTSKQLDVSTSIAAALLYSKSYPFKDIPYVRKWSSLQTKTDEIIKASRRNNFVHIKDGFNFNSFFVIDTNNFSINNDDTYTPKKKKTKNVNVREFIEFHKGKKRSRIILSRFCDAIC